mmetsp:Transcript_16882/g.25221  ORF Transcript_16882/g.25221 Transcript_16882/m.25221 type:complete len:432 (-) Transcript_16882:124-1419(-)
MSAWQTDSDSDTDQGGSDKDFGDVSSKQRETILANLGFDTSDDGTSVATVCNELSELCGGLCERRGSTRVESLQSISQLLALIFCPEAAYAQCGSIIQGVNYSLRKGSSDEQALAFQVIQLTAISLATFCTDDGNASSDVLYTEFKKSLRAIISDSSRVSRLREQAVRTLGVLSFVCDDTELLEDILCVAKVFQQIARADLKDTDESLLCQCALGTWSTLLTIVSAKQVVDSIFPDYVEDLERLVNYADPAIVPYVANAMALCVEIHQEHDSNFDVYDIACFINFEDFVDALSDRIDRPHRGKSKLENAQRKSMRPVLAFLQEASVSNDQFDNKQAPLSERIIINKQKITFHTFEEVVRLTFFKSVLRSGFQTHFQYNNLLHDVFEVDIAQQPSAHRLSKIEKRLHQSKNSAKSKQRTTSRAQNRRQKYQQ